MSLSEEIKKGLDNNAMCFDKLMLQARDYMDDMEKRLKLITEILNDGLDSENLEYDFQAVNMVHKIAYGGQFPKETKHHKTEF